MYIYIYNQTITHICSAVEIICLNHLLKLCGDMICCDYLLRSAVEIICGNQLTRLAVELIMPLDFFTKMTNPRCDENPKFNVTKIGNQ